MRGMESTAESHLAKANDADLARQIKHWGNELGFQQVGIVDCELGEAETRLLEWVMDLRALPQAAKQG